MKEIKYIIYQEGEHFVAQCLNVDVSSFGSSVDEAIKNLREAVELYFEDNNRFKLLIKKFFNSPFMCSLKVSL